MNKLALAAAAALTLGTFSVAVIAQEDPTDFNTVDSNKDGVVTFEEALAVHASLSQLIFDQADTNGDGTLDEAEFLALQTLAISLGTEDTSQLSEESSSVESSSEEAPQ